MRVYGADLNMLCTPNTQDIPDFNEPSGHPRSALAALLYQLGHLCRVTGMLGAGCAMSAKQGRLLVTLTKEATVETQAAESVLFSGADEGEVAGSTHTLTV